jgi:hypothetical protein
MYLSQMSVGKNYKYINSTVVLVYLGAQRHPLGWFYQFANLNEPKICWLELQEYELRQLEEST